MNELDFKENINNYIKEICHYSQLQVFATSSYQKNYFQYQIDDTVNGLINYIQIYYKESSFQQPSTMQLQQEPIPQSNHQFPEDMNQPNPINQLGSPIEAESLPEISMEELTMNDGGNGNKSYVAVNGYVYDVTNAIRWGGGTHFGLYAGRDYTNEFNVCHSAMYDILKILPIVGILRDN